ncbi:MAG: endonuclease V [archaeon]
MKPEDVAEKYNINLKKLEDEQIKLAKTLSIKDSRDFSEVELVGGCDNIFFENKIISAIVVVDRDGEIVAQEYFSDKLKFPYISGFRAYRELPSMVSCYDKLEVKPEIMFIHGHGTAHVRLGLASHFSIATGSPAIGVADNLVIGEEKGESVLLDGKEVGKVLVSKEGSKPIYVSPGNLVSLKSAIEFTKKYIVKPHKLPEPIVLAHKYGKKVREEIFNK